MIGDPNFTGTPEPPAWTTSEKHICFEPVFSRPLFANLENHCFAGLNCKSIMYRKVFTIYFGPQNIAFRVRRMSKSMFWEFHIFLLIRFDFIENSRLAYTKHHLRSYGRVRKFYGRDPFFMKFLKTAERQPLFSKVRFSNLSLFLDVQIRKTLTLPKQNTHFWGSSAINCVSKFLTRKYEILTPLSQNPYFWKAHFHDISVSFIRFSKTTVFSMVNWCFLEIPGARFTSNTTFT